ncbi:MAG TPA: 50S ribosomal protein L30e [Candidatus Norongarragalinales archaeon]|nr:50S ribosomal protein L30e [Candidatus Norongarragalinales archaeon]
MDLSQSIRLAVDSGKVELGLQKTLKLSLVGGAKAIVVSKTCPGGKELQGYCKASKIPLLEFNGNGVELGAVCGKPFSVSALAVLEEGNSDILKIK